MKLNRRHFLTASAAAAASACGSGETGSAAAEGGSGPSDDALKQAASQTLLRLDGLSSPVIIDSIRLLRKDGEYFVHVRSKDGAEGISVTNSRAAYLYPILKELIIPFLVGKDARLLESELLWELYRYRSNYKLQGLAFWCPHAWVEFALLDMLGRMLEKPIGDLLGGVIHNEAAFYVASGNRDTTPEEEVEYLQKLIDETGAPAVKFRLGGRMSRNQDAMPGRTPKLIELARKQLGGEIALHGDTNSSYDPPQAIEVGRMMEAVNAVFYEEPCQFDHLWETKQVADALTIPVAGGEQEYSERRFRWAIANRGLDIVQPDLHYYGGMIRSLRVAKMAEAAGITITPHISGGFGFVYMLHFVSSVENLAPYHEYKRNIEKYRDWFDPKLEIRDGKLTVPRGPGVGIRDLQGVIRGAEVVV